MKLSHAKIFSLFCGCILACSTPLFSIAAAQTVAKQESSGELANGDNHSADGNEILTEFCTKCHNFEDYAGGIDLEGIDDSNINQYPEIGERVIKRLRAGMMPPAGEPRPDHDAMQALAAAFEHQIDAGAKTSPGRPGLHRLNRSEYQNAIRDLLGLEINAAEFLPPDDSSRGFDNQASSLGLSPALLEAYLATGSKVSRLALGGDIEPVQTLYRVAEDENQNFRIEGLPLGTRGGIRFTHNFPVDGQYNIKIFPVTQRGAFNAGPFGSIKGEKLEVLIDGELLKVFDWDAELVNRRRQTGEEEGSEALPSLDVSLAIAAGPHDIGITFLSTNYAPGLDINNDFERSKIETGSIAGFTFYPHVDSVRLDGPYAASNISSTPSREKLFICYPILESEASACAEKILTNLARLAFRGYDTPEDMETLMSFYNQGREHGGFETGLGMALQRMLSSPKFIYRMEEEPDNVAVGESYRISDLDLASRLSFFLWSSIPDQALLALASQGSLSNPEVLDQQVKRMLIDPKSAAMTENFAGQWLALRNLDSHVPVVEQFPDFDNLLRQSFKRETELFFDSLIRENRPVTELLTAKYTFVNERLATHYGIPGIKGERFRRVELSGEFETRMGILGKGSMLTVASQPGRTSPVIRGYWVLSNIIGVEPPPPPPNVPALEAKASDNAGNTALPSMREQLEAHRENPACQGCHRLMDPIGFALENFDAIGRFRTNDNGNAVDPTGLLYDGSRIGSTADLVNSLLKYEDSIARNITQKMLTYALGRGMEYQDMPLVRKVKEVAARDGYRFQALISAVVSSEAFLNNIKSSDENVVAQRH